MGLRASDRDPSADPGVDFYRFANGGWLDANPIPAGYGAWGAFEEVSRRNEVILRELLERAAAEPVDELDRLLGDAFAAGLDVAAIEAVGLEPIAPLLRAIAAADGLEAVLALLPTLHRWGIFALFGWRVTVDHDDCSRHLLWLAQAGLGLPDREMYFDDGHAGVALRAAYVEHVAAQLAHAGVPSERATSVLELETRLAVLHLKPEERRDVERTHNRFERAALTTLAPELALPSYFSALGAGATGSVNVENPRLLERLHGVVETTAPATLRAYLTFTLVRAVANALPARISDEDFAFYGRRIKGQQEQHERSKRVIDAIGEDLGEALAQRYVTRNFPREAKQRAASMVAAILEEMRASIRTRAWMGAETRARAEAKLDALGVKIGYPDRWREWSGLEIGRTSYAANRLNATRFELDRQLAKLDAVGRPRRVGDARPHRQRLLPPDAQRDRRPGRDPAAAAVRRRRGRRRQLRRHRHGHRARDHPRLRRPGPALRRRRGAARVVDDGGRRALHRTGRAARRAIRRLHRARRRRTSTVA